MRIRRAGTAACAAALLLLCSAALGAGCGAGEEAPPPRPEAAREAPAEPPAPGPAAEPGADAGPSPAPAAEAPAAASLEEIPPVVRGRDGWLFLGAELRHLSLGRFWGEAAAAVSRARKPEWADPLAAILDVKRQLDERGIDLLFVPVPAKAAIHREEVPEAYRPARRAGRADASDAEFYALLREKGVPVLDLAPLFLEHRGEPGRPLYAKQDTHWSGAGLELAARKIAERIRIGHPAWLAAQAKREYTVEPRRVTITGDLWRMLDDPSLPKEELALHVVGRTLEGSAELQPVEPSTDSPVLVLGDSYALVFHAGGDMHARGAGLPDHLARELGFPVDLEAVRGSGATPARVNLLRRADGLAGKHLVLWVLAAREFTESLQGWRVLPLAR